MGKNSIKIAISHLTRQLDKKIGITVELQKKLLKITEEQTDKKLFKKTFEELYDVHEELKPIYLFIIDYALHAKIGLSDTYKGYKFIYEKVKPNAEELDKVNNALKILRREIDFLKKDDNDK
jgi:hypothetical protein